jgi:hypothetical protein
MRLTSAGMPSMNWRRRSHEGHPPALLPSSTSVFTPRPFRCHAVIILYDAHAYRWSRSQGVSESRPTAKAQPRVRLRLRRRLVEIHVPAHPPASKRPHKVNETPFRCGALYCCDARIRSSASLREATPDPSEIADQPMLAKFGVGGPWPRKMTTGERRR